MNFYFIYFIFSFFISFAQNFVCPTFTTSLPPTQDAPATTRAVGVRRCGGTTRRPFHRTTAGLQGTLRWRRAVPGDRGPAVRRRVALVEPGRLPFGDGQRIVLDHPGDMSLGCPPACPPPTLLSPAPPKTIAPPRPPLPHVMSQTPTSINQKHSRTAAAVNSRQHSALLPVTF